MSEYQYYEWQTIDRLLTDKEQDAVRELSSHIEVSSSRAIVTYAWGSFKHDPRLILARFFDAHIYLANWGSRRLIFRFPSGLLSQEGITPYCVQDRIMFKQVNGVDILDMDLSEEEGGMWVEAEGSLSGLIPLRDDILRADYRCVYLAWLKVMSLIGNAPPRGRKSELSRSLPPVVPPGLRQLSPALKRFLEQFDVSLCLVEAAAEISPELAETPEPDFRSLVAQLSREECDGYLSRLAQGYTSTGMELRKRLLALMPRTPVATDVRRSLGELLKRVDMIERARKKREMEEMRRKHIAEMEALASREAETWQQVDNLVDMKQPKHYDAAVKVLAQLKALAAFRNTQADFRTRLKVLCERYKSRSGFQQRVQHAKLHE